LKKATKGSGHGMSYHAGARLEKLRKTTKHLNEYMRLLEGNLQDLRNIN